MKEKKSKKHHKKSGKRSKDKYKNTSESSSSSQESDGSEEWEEKQVTLPPVVKVNQVEERDSWMAITDSFTFSKKPASTRTKAKKDEETLKKLGLDKPGQHANELNPYWKDGGSGLPTVSSAPEKPSSSGSIPAVGDGGLRWLQKAYQRAVEQARDEDRSLEDVVSERYGSLKNLERMIDEASKKAGVDSRDYKSGSRHTERHRHSRSPPHRRHSRRDDDFTSSSYKKPSKFIAPGDDVSESHLGATSRHSNQKQGSVPRWKKKGVELPTTSSKSDSPPLVPLERSPSPSLRISSREDTPERSPENSEPVVLLTQTEMNEIGAKIIKAEIMGNNELANQLKKKLEDAKRLREENPSASSGSSMRGRTEQVILMTTDKKGFTRPLQSRGEEQSGGVQGRRGKRQKMTTHDKDGVRERYFADDDKYSLKQLFEREKLGTAEDQDAMFARLAGKGVGKTSDEYDMDDAMTSRANRVINDAKVEEGERLRAIMEHKKSSSALHRCRYCFEGKDTPKHLIVSAGMKVYVRVPENESLTTGECVIVPMQHVNGSTFLDEDVLAEIKIFQKGLTAMYKDRELDVVFFEACMNLRSFPHMVIHCVPLPKDVGYLAPMYFKKAILESETEWAHNKKLVELKQKSIQKSVPKGLPYFSVEFGTDGGFAHVIEDEQLFPQKFAQEIIGGMLDLDPNAWRRPPRQQFEEQRKRVLELSEWWQPYDWTKRLREDSNSF